MKKQEVKTILMNDLEFLRNKIPYSIDYDLPRIFDKLNTDDLELLIRLVYLIKQTENL